MKNLNEYLDRHEFAAGDKTVERKGKDAFYRMYDAEKKGGKGRCVKAPYGCQEHGGSGTVPG